jgi:hypothetical protein
MQDRRILIVEVQDIGCCRLPGVLSEVGILTAALCRPDSRLAHSRFIDPIFVRQSDWGRNMMRPVVDVMRRCVPRFADFAIATVPPSAKFLSVDPADLWRQLVAAIETSRPEFIIFGDEVTRRVLTNAMRHLEAGTICSSADLVTVMRRSLGAPRHFETVVRKSALVEVARDLGLLTPTSQVIENASEIGDFADRHGYPVVLKRDFGSGGTKVAICNDQRGASAALKTLDRHPDAIRTTSSDGRGFGWYEKPPRTIVQTFIDGRDTMCNFAAMNGRVLASFESALVERAWHLGPASVMRFAPNAAVAAQTERLVRFLDYSGFGEIDYIVHEPTGRPYLLEFNPRPTHATHLGKLLGADLCAAFRLALDGHQPKTLRPLATQIDVALFPPGKPDDTEFSGVLRDLPTNDEPLLRFLCKPQR